MPGFNGSGPTRAEELHREVLAWYAANARELPWREPDVSPWAVLVSEIMLQQTPVNRVLPVYEAWMEAWPTPADLAADAPGEAVRAWGRLGYPRRALRLHASAVAIVERHDGQVPSDIEELRALPGIGDYTAAAVATFAFGQSHAVLDTNVRRVLERVVGGEEFPQPSLTKPERERAVNLLPQEDAPTWSVAVMELGALVCTATSPKCTGCPLHNFCTWRLAGKPAYDGAPRKAQTYAGTDRQCRGRLLAIVRDAPGSVSASALVRAWNLDDQRDRALASLLADGLVVEDGDRYRLP
ncbi:MAG TPA: A/G-specific adenine glycosylase [Marmoricola sp.]|nr:A/G-specific adenine glycosylase [Marmoricola sp.]